jgi:energy-coupling factor transporter ATP-binding protein EcfA2
MPPPTPQSAVRNPQFTAVLTGNPNCGKTTLFNALRGLRAKVGNCAGVVFGLKARPNSARGEASLASGAPGGRPQLPQGLKARVKGPLGGLSALVSHWMRSPRAFLRCAPVSPGNTRMGFQPNELAPGDGKFPFCS